MPRPEFDWSFNLGHVLTILTILSGGVAVWTDMRSEAKTMDVRVTSLERQNDILASITTKIIALEAWRSQVDATLLRGREERLKFQDHATMVQDRMLASISAIQSDLAVIKGALAARGNTR